MTAIGSIAERQVSGSRQVIAAIYEPDQGLVRFWRNLPLDTSQPNDRKVPVAANTELSPVVAKEKTLPQIPTFPLQKALAGMVIKQGSVADVAKQHFDFLLARYLLHLGQ